MTPAASVVCAGSARSQSPVVAVSVALKLRVQPRLVSKLSKNTVVAPAALTVRDTVALRVSEPPAPWTFSENVPVVAVDDAVMVSVLAALPFAGGVTDAGLKAQLTPADGLVQERLTALANPLDEVTVHVVLELPGRVMETADGLQAMLKSGVAEAAGVTVAQLLTRLKQDEDEPPATTL
jgi:hypothetical protein